MLTPLDMGIFLGRLADGRSDRRMASHLEKQKMGRGREGWTKLCVRFLSDMVFLNDYRCDLNQLSSTSIAVAERQMLYPGIQMLPWRLHQGKPIFVPLCWSCNALAPELEIG